MNVPTPGAAGANRNPLEPAARPPTSCAWPPSPSTSYSTSTAAAPPRVAGPPNCRR
jgi:hypothetical protein